MCKNVDPSSRSDAFIFVSFLAIYLKVLLVFIVTDLHDIQ